MGKHRSVRPTQPAAVDASAAAAETHALPPELLAAIFANLKTEDRAVTAMVCRDWAAVHADASSKIWEAANVCDMMHRALEMSVRDFGAGDVCLWLARRAPGLRQLEVFKSSYDPRCMDASTASDRFDRYETSAGAQSVVDRREGHHPILTACCGRDQQAVAPLEALRMDEMCESVYLVVKFSKTLRHLVLPGLIWRPAMHLANVIRHLKALETLDARIIECSLGDEEDAGMVLLYAAARSCKRLKHLVIRPTDSAEWDLDLPPDLSTLTALTTLRLDLDHLVDPHAVDSDGGEQEQMLLLSAPGLQYLSLVENRRCRVDDGFCRGHKLGQLTGLQVLISDSVTWYDSLPRSLRALSLDFIDHPQSAVSLIHLCGALCQLTSLEHLALKTDWLEGAPQLRQLFSAFNRCALTHLALSRCELEGLPLQCQLPASLEIVDLSYNQELELQEWLSELASLPHLRHINLHESATWYADGGGTETFTDPEFAPALESIWWDSNEDVELLAQARELEGLPKVALATDDIKLQEKAWHKYRAALDTPPISYGKCALLPSPQLNGNSTANWRRPPMQV